MAALTNSAVVEKISLHAEQALQILYGQLSRPDRETAPGAAEQPKLLLALDRDGTLVAYADRPEEAVVDDHLRSLLTELSTYPELVVAFVSARSIAQLHSDFHGVNAIFAGNYGMEIEFQGGERVVQQPAVEAKARLKEVRDHFASLTKINAVVEDHGLSVCLHWQTVEANSRYLVHQKVSQLAEQFPDLRFHALPTSYEVLPQFEWNKGKALELITGTLSENGIRPENLSFFGDSIGDEPGFAWINAQGGTTVKVGSAGEQTVSKLQLSDTTETKFVLEQLLAHLRSRR